MTHWRMLKCRVCRSGYPSLIIVQWGFDKHGNLTIKVVCRVCLHKDTVTHSADEIAADRREAFMQWAMDQSDPMSVDFLIWENQMQGYAEDAEEGDDEPD